MGTACGPSGKRLALPRKIAATCAGLSGVTGLFADTSATTPSARAPLSMLASRHRAVNPMSTRDFIARFSEDEVRGHAEDVRAAAGLETGLDVAEGAIRTLVAAYVVVLRLERRVAPRIPTHAG